VGQLLLVLIALVMIFWSETGFVVVLVDTGKGCVSLVDECRMRGTVGL